MTRIRIIRTTPHEGRMLAPGREIEVDPGLARALRAAGKAEVAVSAAAGPLPAAAPAKVAKGRARGARP